MSSSVSPRGVRVEPAMSGCSLIVDEPSASAAAAPWMRTGQSRRCLLTKPHRGHRPSFEAVDCLSGTTASVCPETAPVPGCAACASGNVMGATWSDEGLVRGYQTGRSDRATPGTASRMRGSRALQRRAWCRSTDRSSSPPPFRTPSQREPVLEQHTCVQDPV